MGWLAIIMAIAISIITMLVMMVTMITTTNVIIPMTVAVVAMYIRGVITMRD